jgi:mannan endo-1,4-beta-mannosidase
LKLKGPASAPPPKYMDQTDHVEHVEVKETQLPAGYFELEGKPFCFAGMNNYYLTYKSKKMVDDVLDSAKKMGLSVIRVWGFLDRGSLDGSIESVDGDGTKDNVWFQSWDSKTNKAIYNDGPDGLERLDYVMHAARERGLKILPAFTNNWKEFGGIAQYVVWLKLKHFHHFYTEPRARQAYKDYVSHVLNRKNSYNGIVYKDDPTVFAWELANEPRCRQSDKFDAHEGWDTTTLVKWAEEMSAYIKSIAPNHMVAMGDEGFLNGGRKHWAYQAQDGVDHEAIMRVKDIDFGTFHLYPDNWGTGVKFATNWVYDHIDVARRVGKPTVLEEYNVIVRRNEKYEVIWGWERRKNAYINWNEIMVKHGGAGSMFWMLVGKQDDGTIYPDYDHYNVYYPEPSTELLKQYAELMNTQARACELAPATSGGAASPFVKARFVPPQDVQLRP